VTEHFRKSSDFHTLFSPIDYLLYLIDIQYGSANVFLCKHMNFITTLNIIISDLGYYLLFRLVFFARFFFYRFFDNSFCSLWFGRLLILIFFFLININSAHIMNGERIIFRTIIKILGNDRGSKSLMRIILLTVFLFFQIILLRIFVIW
jgi:hypothetical protein